jgi:TonB-dependent SusC/RagA subfamily outer membrane receptor
MFFAKGNNAKAQGGVKTCTELSPAKTNNIRGQISAAAFDKIGNSRIITGKVIDADGNPVPFATIQIKNTEKFLSADQNGDYSIKIHSGDILIISAASFKEAKVTAGTNALITTVMEKMGGQLLGDVLTGGLSYSEADQYIAPGIHNYIASIQVKDDISGISINKAKIIVTKSNTSYSDTAFTDKKGGYKLKGIKRYENYFIKVEADGYETNEFSINANDFNDRKKEWEVLLRKEQVEPIKSTVKISGDLEKPILLRGGILFRTEDAPIYVVDGTIMLNLNDINPDNVESVNILKGPEATALFGPKGANGAIIITTRKVKEKTLKEVVVSSESGTRRMAGMVGIVGVSGSKLITVKPDPVVKEDNEIKIYPNPVQHGNTINISLKLKQTSLYQIQIIDVQGRIVLQKQINVNTKEVTEKIFPDSRWSSGVYYINIIDNKNQLISKTSFRFQ